MDLTTTFFCFKFRSSSAKEACRSSAPRARNEIKVALPIKQQTIGDGPRNFENRSSDELQPLSWQSFSNLPPPCQGRTLSVPRFKVHQSLYTTGLQWH
ncbi:hypothetical protein TNCV_4596561 [Trichonephila clavipes]|uniref:Uncharacterized protein n=1 Tax=Trichonephila clavipes TaxID=2585209 RepID=A0A8X7BJX9_TRICX|nr:hypothetical protein TNCV_4596561 [Trichonephila clavipes]